MSAAGTREGVPTEGGEYPRGYTCLSNAALTMWWNGEISESAYRVYSYLAFLSKDNVCWPKQATIAAKVSKSLATVKRALKELETRLLISRQAQYRKGEQCESEYMLLPIGGGGTVAHTDDLPSSVSAPNELGGSSPMNGGVAHLDELGGSSPKMSYQQQDSLEQDSIKNNNTGHEDESKKVDVVVALLCEHGVKLRQAKLLTERFSPEQIALQIKYLPYRNAKTNKAGLLRQAIIEGWDAPPSYVPLRSVRATAAASKPPVPAHSASEPVPAAESQTTAPTAAQDAPAALSGTQPASALPDNASDQETGPASVRAYLHKKNGFRAVRRELPEEVVLPNGRAPRLPLPDRSAHVPPSASSASKPDAVSPKAELSLNVRRKPSVGTAQPPKTRFLPPKTDTLTITSIGQGGEQAIRAAFLSRRFETPQHATV